MIVVDILKWDGQWPKSIQALALAMSLVMYSSLLIILLIWLQVSLSRLGANKLLHLSIALISSSLENGVHTLATLLGISFKSWRSTLWDWAKLKKLWRVSHRSSNSIYSWLLNWIALTAGSFYFLTQFISFYRPYFLLAISVILS